MFYYYCTWRNVYVIVYVILDYFTVLKVLALCFRGCISLKSLWFSQQLRIYDFGKKIVCVKITSHISSSSFPLVRTRVQEREPRRQLSCPLISYLLG